MKNPEAQEDYVEEGSTASKPMHPENGRSGYFPKRYFIYSILVSALLSALSIVFYDHFCATKIVALDFKGFVVYQRELYMNNKINDEQFRKNVDRLELAVMGVPKNHVVLMGDSVLGRVETIDYKQWGKERK